MNIESADKGDARDLAYLINLAGEGLPEYLWSSMLEPGDNPLDVGARRSAREEGGFSYHNAFVARVGDQVAGMLLSYLQRNPYDLGDIQDYPEVVQPLVSLESKAPGSWYINAIATFEEFRGRGVASDLMRLAEKLAVENGADTLSLIVASENKNARELYSRLEYELVDCLPVVEYPGALHGGHWELLTKRCPQK